MPKTNFKTPTCPACGREFVEEGEWRVCADCPFRAVPKRPARAAAKAKLVCGGACRHRKSEIIEADGLAYCLPCPNRGLIEDAIASVRRKRRTIHRSEHGSAGFWRHRYLALVQRIGGHETAARLMKDGGGFWSHRYLAMVRRTGGPEAVAQLTDPYGETQPGPVRTEKRKGVCDEG